MKISIFLISLLLIVIVPNTFYMYYDESTSTGVGLAITILIICFLYLLQYRGFNLDKSLLPIFIFLIFTFLTSIYSMISFDTFEYKRFFLSYLLIYICVLAVFCFVIFSLKIIDRKVYNYVSFVFYIILFDGIYLLIKNTFFIWGKKTLLFPEMSHFSIIFGPLLLFKVLTSKNTTYIYSIILISLILALNIQNLTLLISTFFIMMIYSIKKTFLFFLIPVSIGALYFDLGDFTYFIDRIPSIDSKNVSTLVFLSGWERVYLNLIDSNFFGIGFNQLGIVGNKGFYQSELTRLGLPGLNIYDAGGVAPKLLSELGIIGIAFIFGYLFYLAKAIYIVKKKKLIYNYLDTFYISIFIMSFVSMFIRSSGYFSPIVFLLLSSIIYINKFKLTDHNIFLNQKIPKL
jgi:hypothetical protein